MIYFIRAGETGPVKIGSSQTPEQRMVTLQRKATEKLALIRVVEGEARQEHWYHARFNHRRIGGEWFHFDPLMMTVLPPDLPQFDWDTYCRAKRNALLLSRTEPA